MDRTLEELSWMMELTQVNLMELSRRTGVAYGTLHSIKKGTANPTISTIKAVKSGLFQPHDDTNKSCEGCAFYIQPYTNGDFGGCEVVMMPFNETPKACWLFREATKNAT